jgi:hypothetical protein
VKRCASCGREIAESGTVCDLCERWAADHIAAPSSVPPAPPASITPPQAVAARPTTPASQPQAQAVAAAPSTERAPRSGRSRRELMFFVIALAVGGVITFAFVGSRGTPSTTVAAANRVTAKEAPVAPAAPIPTQKWSTARRAYWTANQRHSDAFELPAENTVAIWLNYVRPLLVIRCIGKRTEAFVYTGSALKIEPNTEDHGVTFRFDGAAGQSEHWPDSAEHDALFAPDGAAFAQRVMTAKTLRFGYTPHNAEPVEAQFHVDGLAELIAPAAKDCGWQK